MTVCMCECLICVFQKEVVVAYNDGRSTDHEVMTGKAFKVIFLKVLCSTFEAHYEMNH